MNENMLDVLDFLFDNYLNCDSCLANDEETITTELQEAGFSLTDINKAFDWLGELSDISNGEGAPVLTHGGYGGSRVYTSEECRKLCAEVRGFLIELEQLSLIEGRQRELIIDRAMALEIEEINLSSFKTIVGLVLLNQGCDDEIYAQIEEYIYEGCPMVAH